MHITLHRGKYHFSGLGSTAGHLFRFDGRLQDCNSLLHGSGCFHNLRQEHFTGTKEISYDIHPFHKRSVNDIDRFRISCQRLFQIGFQMIANSFNQRVNQTVFQCTLPPGFVFVFRRTLFLNLQILNKIDQLFHGFGAAVQNSIFSQCAEARFDIVVTYGLRRIHNTHIHPFSNGMIQEDGMHCLSHIIISSERKRQIAYTATYSGSGQILLDPLHCLNKSKTISVMLFHTGSNGQHIRIKYYIMRIKV